MTELYANYRDSEKDLIFLNEIIFIGNLWNAITGLIRYSDRKRAHKRGLAVDFESVEANNPKPFWKLVQTLGPKQYTSIPMKLYTNTSNNMSTNIKDVLNVWKKDFQHLYNKPEVDTEDGHGYANLLENKSQLVHNMSDSGYVSNAYINEDSLYNEIDRAVSKLKTNK